MSTHAGQATRSALALPPGAFINPDFAKHAAPSNLQQHQGYAPSARPGSPHDQAQQKSNPLSRTAAGHKRKLEALRPPPQDRMKKAAPQTAPAVPSFGASILPSKPATSKTQSTVKTGATSKQKLPPRSLGLTPGTNDLQYSSSDGEDEGKEVDEEAMYAELGTKLTFEHNGVVMSLGSEADLAAWKKERQKNWPTKARVAERDQERQRVGEERKRLLAGARILSQSTQSKPKSKTRRGKHSESGTSGRTCGQGAVLPGNDGAETDKVQVSELEKTKMKLKEQTDRLDELRRKVAESEARNRAARAQLDARNEEKAIAVAKAATAETLAATTAADLNGGVSADVEAGSQDETDLDDAEESSTTSSSSDSDSTPEADLDDDGPPEEVASKPTADTGPAPQRLLCRYFIASGYCRDGDLCRYRHELPQRPSAGSRSQLQPHQETQQMQHALRRARPPEIESNIEKKSIFQRLVDQEQDEEDRLALKVIKYLGTAGFFKPVSDEGDG